MARMKKSAASKKTAEQLELEMLRAGWRRIRRALNKSGLSGTTVSVQDYGVRIWVGAHTEIEGDSLDDLRKQANCLLKDARRDLAAATKRTRMLGELVAAMDKCTGIDR